jgi:hypothetical protein
MNKMLNKNDTNILIKAKAGIIVVGFEGISAPDTSASFLRRIFKLKDPRLKEFEKTLKKCPNMNSIIKLTELKLLRKEGSEETSYWFDIDPENAIEKIVKKDIYKITQLGHEKLSELYPELESDKVINIQDFKNNNCTF